jgi:uncharacterized protein YlxW (UPF0749 family)
MWWNRQNRKPVPVESEQEKHTRLRADIERLKQEIKELRDEDLLHQQAINDRGVDTMPEITTLETSNNIVIAHRQKIIELAQELGVDPQKEIQGIF